MTMIKKMLSSRAISPSIKLILFGSPGAGKGTQASLIAERYHLPHLSTGELLRIAISQQSPLGKQVKYRVKAGILIPDDLINQLMFDRLSQSDCQHGFLLDGFPRTLAQATALHQEINIDHVIEIDLSPEEAIKRLSGRWIHPGSGRTYHLINHPPKQPGIDDLTGEPLIQRSDDQEDTIRRRLLIYQQETKPLRDYYLSQSDPSAPRYTTINGRGTISEVSKQIFAAIDQR